jgi:hypothetical protein
MVGEVAESLLLKKIKVVRVVNFCGSGIVVTHLDNYVPIIKQRVVCMCDICVDRRKTHKQ